MIFMGMWVIVNWWVWPVPDFHFRKLEAMVCVCVCMYVCVCMCISVGVIAIGNCN